MITPSMLLLSALLSTAAVPPHTAATVPVRFSASMTAFSGKVSFTVRNNTPEPLELRVEGAVTVVQPGDTHRFTLRPGQYIVLNKSAANLHAGVALVEALREYNHSVVSINSGTADESPIRKSYPGAE